MQINQKRLVNKFLELVQIDSESGEEKQIINHLEKELQSLGFKTYIDKVGNLIGSNSNKPIIALIAHVDTVKPGKNIKPIITKTGVIKTDGSTILGSDNKAGIAAILEILELLKENQISIGLEIIFTVREEIGLFGSSGLDFKRIKSERGINVDGHTGDIDIAEPGIMQFDIEIRGKAAHAGLEPEKGISAIQAAANAISNLKWGRIDKETTANIGVINGGNARNVVSERVQIQAEIRSRNIEKFKKYCKLLESQFKKSTEMLKGKISIKSIQTTHAFFINKKDSFLNLLMKVCNDNKIKPELQLSGGGTDANALMRNSIKCVTMGTYGYNIHSTKEYIKIKDLILGTKIIFDTILELKEGS